MTQIYDEKWRQVYWQKIAFPVDADFGAGANADWIISFQLEIETTLSVLNRDAPL